MYGVTEVPLKDHQTNLTYLLIPLRLKPASILFC